MDDRFNTASGWVLFSGIVALGASIASGMYFHADSNDVLEQGEAGYFVEGVEETGGADAGPSLAEVLVTADAAAGEKVFAKCQACHTINQGGANGIGPNLYGIMGKAIGGGAAGFAYSSALADKGGQWTWENMDEWLKSPKTFASGTKMSFAGLSKIEDRANVMEYMAANGGAPAKPEFVPAEETEEGVSVEGEEPTEAEAAGAMGADEPVASENAGGDNEGATKVD